ADGEDLPLLVVEEPETHGVGEGGGAVGQLVEGRRVRRLTGIQPARQRAQAGGQRHQRAGEVAAVDRRDVARQQRRERLRVVPVEQVPFVALQPLDGGQRRV